MDILIHGASDLALPIALGFTVFAIVALAFGALLGALRGVHRSFLRVGLMIVSGVAAFFVALPSKNIYISNLHKLVMEMDIPWITASPDVESILEGYVLVFAAPLIFLAAFIAQNKCDPTIASALSVYFHAVAGQTLAGEFSAYGVTPSDLPKAIAREIAIATKSDDDI